MAPVRTPPVHLNYIFCDNPATYASAIWVLRQAPYLILDCEGYNLGRSGGSVTLICVGTPFAEHIFLFDVLSPFLTSSDINSLLRLLGDRNILKIVWDGRMDYLEIWSTFGVTLEHVLDLQVAEVMSRSEMRGEGELHRLKRLPRGFVSLQQAQKQEIQLDGLHAVVGLQKCWKDCGYAEEVGKDPEVVKMHKSKGSWMWVERPLTEQLLQYAAKDILLIGVLYPHFYRSGWIPMQPSQYDFLLGQCQRYVTAHKEQGKSTDTDVFRPGGIMPLDVLNEPYGPKHKCLACNRWLSLAAYETLESGSPGIGGYKYRMVTLRRPRCRLCHVLALKSGLKMEQVFITTI